jgi:hypothetical protein
MRKILGAALALLLLTASAWASGTRFQTPNEQFFDASGAPLTGGQLFFYQTGTTTPLATYSDVNLTVPNTNPVILNSAGRAGNIFLQSASYKVVLEDASGAQIWTADPVGTTTAGIIYWGATTAGTANAQTATFNPTFASLQAGQVLSFIAGFSNTASLTLNGTLVQKRTANGLVNLTGNEVVATQVYDVVYDGSVLELLTPNTLTGSIPSLVSATTTDLGSVAQQALDISGTTAITSFGASATIGDIKFVRFTGSLTLTAAVSNFPGGGVVTQAGDTTVVRYEGSSTWRMLSYARANGAPLTGSGVVGLMRGVTGTAAGGTKTASWTAKELVAETALGGTAYKGAALTLAFNGATTGAGGMDTGSVPTSGDLYVYAIYNPTTNTWATLGTITADAFTNTYQGVNPVSGYTASLLLWVGKTDSTPNIVGFNQRDRQIFIPKTNALNLSSGTATTVTAISLSGIVPADALSVGGVAGDNNSAAACNFLITADTALNTGTVVINAIGQTTTFAGFNDGAMPFTMPLLTAQTIYYQSVGSAQAARIDISSYTF